MEDEAAAQNGTANSIEGNESNVNLTLRPVFLGNLNPLYTVEQVCDIFERPATDEAAMPVDRVDVKRGYCFLFLKDATSLDEKARTERFVSDINGIRIPGVSNALRAEFARGDGRVKRKEDDRRQRLIHPTDTLFVVNFQEVSTKRDDLKMLFEPYGDLVRIEMKRNYAFVQFKSIEQATKAKEQVNGGKLDQSVLTVEYVAQGDRSGSGGGFNRHDRDRRMPENRRTRSRSRSPPRYRSRSPRRYDSRRRSRSSPDRYRGRMDDRGRGVDDRGRGVDDRGRGVDDRGRGVDDRGRGVDDRGRGMDDRMDRGDRGYRA